MKDCTRVFVATPYGEEGMGGIDRLNDAIFNAIKSQPELNIQPSRLITRGKRGLLAAQWTFALALARFCLAAARGKVDLLHIHLSIRGSSYRKTLIGIAAQTFGVPYIVHLHGINFREFWYNTNKLVKSGLDRLFTHSEQIIVLGQFWAEVVLERLPDLRDKMVILPNATESITKALEAKNNETRVSFLGQLGPRKGTPQMVAALSQLEHRNDWTATLAGDGEVSETRADVRCRGIADRVKVPGWLSTTATSELLRATDILVLPSFAENLPMVIVEAFAHGIAVISTPVGAVPEVITHEQNGLLVPVGNIKALANAIERLLDDVDLRRRLGCKARRDHAERYELDAYVHRLVEIWRRSAAQGPTRASQQEILSQSDITSRAARD
jgi:glycosyltransferase involved in cell wall biosynthesis